MKTTGLNFIEAVKAAKDGKKIRREAWTDPQLTAYANSGWLYMSSLHCPAKHMEVTVDGSLADDWEIVPDPPKTMGFMEAWAEAKQGKKIARLAWSSNRCAKLSEDGVLTIMDYRCVLPLLHIRTEHIDATDWYVVEEEVSHD